MAADIEMEQQSMNAVDVSVIDGNSPLSAFTLEVTELRELMEFRGHEAVQTIAEKYGGVANICNRLFTSPNEGQSSLQGQSIPAGPFFPVKPIF